MNKQSTFKYIFTASYPMSNFTPVIMNRAEMRTQGAPKMRVC